MWQSDNQTKIAAIFLTAIDYRPALILLLAGCSPAAPASSSD
jgi:hypothetical protein